MGLCDQWKQEWEKWVNDTKILIIDSTTVVILKDLYPKTTETTRAGEMKTSIVCITSYYQLANLQGVRNCFI